MGSILSGTEAVALVRALPGVDAVGLEARAAGLATRSVKKESKAKAIDLAISMIDLTTLEGADTPGKVRSLAAKALRPDGDAPSTAAVCVYPSMVATAAEALRGSGVKVASVATGFPAGQVPLDVRLADTESAVRAGADEIDMVINRGAFLSGDLERVFHEIKAVKAATGKVGVNATLPVTLLMMQAVRDYRAATGVQVGVKPAGGIRGTKDAIKYLVCVNETLGDDWLSNEWFRFGASSLLNDLLMQRQKLQTGHYSGPDYVTVD